MFHWICAECGREIAPNLRQCPDCEPLPGSAQGSVPKSEPDAHAPPPVVVAPEPVASPPVVAASVPVPPPQEPATQEAALAPPPLETLAPVEVVAPPAPPPLAAAIQAVPPEISVLAPPAIEAVPLEPEPVQLSLALPIAESTPLEFTAVEAASVEAPAKPVPESEPKPLSLEPKVLVEAVEAGPEVLLETAEPLPDPLLTLAESVRAEQAAVAPVVGLHVEGVAQPTAIEWVPAAPPAEATPEEPVAAPADLAANVEAPPPAEQPSAAAFPEPPLAIAEPTAPVALLAAPESQPIPATALPAEVAALLPEPVAPAPLSEVVSSPDRPKPQAPKESRSTVEVVPEVASSKTHRPFSASFAPGLPVGAYVDCASVLGRSIRAARPNGKPCKPDTSPRMTLPGPTLPPALEHLQGAGLAGVSTAKTSKGKTKASGWLVSVTVMLVLLFMGVAAVSSLTPHSAADAKPSPVVAEPAPADSVPAPSHPLAKSIEVTGFRIVVDPNRKSEIHYLLVNHSAAPLDDVTVFVTLRAANGKSGQPPLCRFSFRASGIGAFESKEMVSAIEKPTRTIALPEWQDLRADVQVGQ